MPRKIESHEEREQPPVGTHPARLIGITFTGWQKSEYGLKEEMLWAWELAGVKQANGEPFIVSAFYGLTLGGEKGTKLAKHIQSWRSFTLTDKHREVFAHDATPVLKPWVGQIGMVVLEQGAKGVNLTNLAAWPKGLPQPPGATTPLWYHDPQSPEANFGKLINFHLDRLKKSVKPNAPPPAPGQGETDFAFGANPGAQPEPETGDIPQPGLHFPL